ncbi:hypothetical protein HDU87_004404 [Geranomyces variabilis]|uniref:Uncharacterized protein n=1 Tax=Geranomyces variabilis TaxID=109894 RepID=A0AAD5TJA7_9FUNG|nr:hypothetical protein HDU87_004404 [Geranomyces variabilis]
MWKCAAEILRTPLPFRVDLSADDEEVMVASVKLLRSEDVSSSDTQRATADELLLPSSLTAEQDDEEQNLDHEDVQIRSKTAGVDSARRMLKFLAQMSAVEPNLSHELLEELTFYYLRFGMYEEAYNRLQGYISSYPYNENARLVGYAGLVCYMLWRQEATRVVDHADREEDEGLFGSQTWGSSQQSYTSSYGWSQQTVAANDEAPSVQREFSPTKFETMQLCASSSSFGGTNKQPPSFVATLFLAEGDLASRHYSNAIQHFELSLFLDSSSDIVLFHYLKLMLAAGDVAAATTKITKFIEENPLNPNGYRYFLTLHHTTTKVSSETWIPLAYKLLELDPVCDERVALRPLVDFFEAEYVAENNTEACQTIVNVLAARLDHGGGEKWMWRALGENLARLRKVEASFHDAVWAERENWWPSLHFRLGAHTESPPDTPASESEELVIYKAASTLFLFPARYQGAPYPCSFGLSPETLRPASQDFLSLLEIPLDAIFDDTRPPAPEPAIFANLRPLQSFHEASAERAVDEADELFGAWDQDVEDVCGMMALGLDTSTLTVPGVFGGEEEQDVVMMDVVEAPIPSRPVRAARTKRKRSTVAKADDADAIRGDNSIPTAEATPVTEEHVGEPDAGTGSAPTPRRVVSARRRKLQPAAAEDAHASDADDDATPRPARTHQPRNPRVVDAAFTAQNDAADVTATPTTATRQTRSASKASNPPRVVKRKRGTDEAMLTVADPPAKRKRGDLSESAASTTTITNITSTPARRKVTEKAKQAGKATAAATPTDAESAQDRHRDKEPPVSQTTPTPAAAKRDRAAWSKTAVN